VETCIALALSRKFEEILPNLDRIRYGNRAPSFSARRHFVSADWIPGNEKILRPMNLIADTVCEKEIDRVNFFRKKRKPFPRGLKLEPLELARLRYVSTGHFAEIVPKLPRISVVLFVGGVSGTVVSHMGFAINDGGIVFRHASSRHRMVLDVDAMEYFSTRPSLDGAAFLELL
ncbi:MAG TPA: DUF1460 domain-containing protein, partial [candidate division Zixibacteria bacterium]|nr:DUF1460 domain-containing protein [candidate division Zixibacteria bacterium]